MCRGMGFLRTEVHAGCADVLLRHEEGDHSRTLAEECSHSFSSNKFNFHCFLPQTEQQDSTQKRGGGV